MDALFLLKASGRCDKRGEMALSLPALSQSNASKGRSFYIATINKSEGISASLF
jgi:hypothetical protein